MKHNTVVSKRLIQDHLAANNLKPHTMETNSQSRLSWRQARQQYHTHLEEEKKATEQLSSDKAREILSEKLFTVVKLQALVILCFTICLIM